MGVGLPPSACSRQNSFPSENMSAANRAPRAHSLYSATDDVRPSPAVLHPPDPPPIYPVEARCAAEAYWTISVFNLDFSRNQRTFSRFSLT